MARQKIDNVRRDAHNRNKDGRIKKTSGDRVTKSVSKRLQEVLDARSEANAKSRLLSLPGEIRNSIYEYAIGGYEVVFIWSEDDEQYTTKASPCHSDVKFTNAAWNKIFALGRICRQIHQETKPLPYRLTRFIIAVCDEIDAFLKNMEPYKKQNITTIAFMSESWSEVYDITIPKELYGYKGLTTIISTDMLVLRHRPLVKEFAKKKGCKHLVEHKEADKHTNDSIVFRLMYLPTKWNMG